MAERRILVVANETVAGRELLDDLRARAADGAEVLVVAPALNTRLRHLFADVDKAREGAEQRLAESIEHLQASGIQARGAVGGSDPGRAIEDALFEFDAARTVMSTHRRERSNWLEKKTVERAEEKFDVPITHVVVDLERDWAETGEPRRREAAGAQEGTAAGASADAAGRRRSASCFGGLAPGLVGVDCGQLRAARGAAPATVRRAGDLLA